MSVPVTLRPRGEALAYRTACTAPAIMMRIDPNGLVTTCCKSLQPLGNLGRERLLDIWNGANRAAVVAALEVDDFSRGCQRCGAEIAQEGREVSYAALHDEWSGHLTPDPASRAWPVRMEFNLSNACNLQCIQCDGDSSSAIRIHREHRPPLPKVLGDQFFEDLRVFLPHLERIVFAGGEPFLGAENFRVWDLIAEEAPHIDCLVVTNGTQWTPRIEALLEKMRFSFVFSLDGIHQDTYESIRVGAKLDEVLANIDRFRAHAARNGTTVSVNHCLMPQNLHEFADLLLWADELDLKVDVSVVRTPASASIAALPAEELIAAHERMEAEDARVRPLLRRNLFTWDTERTRLAGQAAAAAHHHSTHTVHFFRCEGSGPYDDRDARAELAAWAPDGQVHTVAVGHDGLIRWSDGAIPDAHDLVGEPLQTITKVVTERFGDLADYQVEATGDDRIDASVRFGDVRARMVSVAKRNDEGWADEALILFAFDAGEGA